MLQDSDVDRAASQKRGGLGPRGVGIGTNLGRWTLLPTTFLRLGLRVLVAVVLMAVFKLGGKAKKFALALCGSAKDVDRPPAEDAAQNDESSAKGEPEHVEVVAHKSDQNLAECSADDAVAHGTDETLSERSSENDEESAAIDEQDDGEAIEDVECTSDVPDDDDEKGEELVAAATEGYVARVRQLIDHGAAVYYAQDTGLTPCALFV